MDNSIENIDHPLSYLLKHCAITETLLVEANCDAL